MPDGFDLACALMFLEASGCFGFMLAYTIQIMPNDSLFGLETPPKDYGNTISNNIANTLHNLMIASAAVQAGGMVAGIMAHFTGYTLAGENYKAGPSIVNSYFANKDKKVELEDAEERRRIGKAFIHCMELRQKYIKLSCQCEQVTEIDCAYGDFNFRLESSGIYAVYNESKQRVSSSPTFSEFCTDLDFILDTIANGPVKTWAYRQLKYLDTKWQMNALENEHKELLQSRVVPHRDLYNVRKVDGHVHLASAMNEKHLLRFIKHKLKSEPDRVVIVRDGKTLTLHQVFESLNLTAYDLSIDTLDVHAEKDEYRRFDRLNLKYNPVGQSRLREIFLKTDNYINGAFFAEITKEVISDLEQTKYQMAEYRVSIYGHSSDEWDKLATWVVDNDIFSDNVRWLIQIPRLYNVYKANGIVSNFEQLLANIFGPLFEVTRDPSTHPKLHLFLQRVVGLDSVDDESKHECQLQMDLPLPREWDNDKAPPYAYYCYYLMANLCPLNQWRNICGYSTFAFRPHSGEAGSTDHLAAAFLSAQSINHGALLHKVPALQYLFYLQQIGLAMSPLSNNALFQVYKNIPFNKFFQRGLNTTLSTDDPLQFHYTREPLMEEYSVAAQIWKYTSVDMCELAKNSVIQSGFSKEEKRRWVGEHGPETEKTNIPESRLEYRHATLDKEKLKVLEMSRCG
ncbi:AMP deaminase [Coemansia sp. RSA 1813]|nr:AMP deaminase [Coemansia sp. RSA 1813]